MRKENPVNGVRWIHVSKPTEEDVNFIRSVFPFDPFVTESIVAPTLHPLIDDFENHLFLILHFPIIYRGWQSNEIAEVDFLITKDVLVTVTYTEFDNIEEIFSAFQAEKIQKRGIGQQTGFILHYVIDNLFNKLISHLDFMEQEITSIEDRMFAKRDSRMVEEISHARRDILDFLRPLRPQATVLETFAEKAEKFYGKTIAPYITDILVTEERIRSIIENQKEIINDLHQTNESLVSSNISSIIRILTIFSAVIMPLNLIASLWGMNHKQMPFRDGPWDFWIIVGFMIVVAILLLVIFRKSKWL
ncbi:MAG: hypothetical protein A3B99_03205 [Candidatus Yanofskybacteria bacterium RIFCSPHIGHO2_02_FULL_44_12b]|uniref:Magnesium transport protein CorA n=2 Tax=Candidatus Yanofskyibacteriota TaxID=1752733 RepID=A0A1F8GLK3_9BACT|nr:MAG: Mg2 transporter protein CorA family protein [Candidatus Yanofskybacteria bacterium GW2011_GWA2_44_9]OGN05314.1 MAG: hypothetical protein A2659_01780 [Candidatus Yanofskybacteria bacterium RIFCSPHIGHO2_01_FULL_44_24]OGN16294.1 MAG: hypothetical protein A3B99_03205 [Candidatus Yanofskybacteria bacterium RIFCSPHIGHO2_02_FULL_44_12b]OGN25546.1 MAG: hypothetical protein A2925_02365 [Candidatus Yanofskybacteria bacterium RIFCSPLOWO2_01_FULL_44_22]